MKTIASFFLMLAISVPAIAENWGFAEPEKQTWGFADDNYPGQPILAKHDDLDFGFAPGIKPDSEIKRLPIPPDGYTWECDGDTGQCKLVKVDESTQVEQKSTAVESPVVVYENWNSNSNGSHGCRGVGQSLSYGSFGGGGVYGVRNRAGLYSRTVTRYQRVRVPCATCPSGWRWETRPVTTNIAGPVAQMRARRASDWTWPSNQSLQAHMQWHTSQGHVGHGETLVDQHNSIHNQIGPVSFDSCGNAFYHNGQSAYCRPMYSNYSTRQQAVYGQSFQVRGIFGRSINQVRGQPVRNFVRRFSFGC